MSRHSWLFSLPLLAAAVAAGVVWAWGVREHEPGDPADADQVAVGAALYDWNCARCHGKDLGGELGWAQEATDLTDEQIKKVAEKLGDVAPAHDDSGRTARLDDAALFQIIDKGAAEVLDKPNSRMSGFGDRLADDEVWAIIAFMKKHWQEIEVAAD